MPLPPRPAGVEWLFLIAGLFLVLHYAWLLDDAFVYFRYIDNWVLLGRGIVYNPGEYAEGYTSPLWLLYLALFRSLGASYWFVLKATGVVSWIVFWLLAIRINRALSPEEVPTVNIPLAILSLNYAVLCYFTSGTEAPFVALVAAVFVLFAIFPSWKPAHFVLPLLPLVRPELALVLLIALGWYRWKTGRNPYLMGALTLIAGGGWLLFRIFYYADLLPTTYYLKNLNDVGQGLLYLHDTLAPYHLYEWFGLGVVSLVVFARLEGRRSLRIGSRALVAMTAVLAIAYTVKVGGDARHYRYLAFPVCAAVLALGGCAERWIRKATQGRMPAKYKPLIAAAGGIAVAALSFSFFPRQLDLHPAFDLAAQPRTVDGIADAAHHRTHVLRFYLSPWSDGGRIELKAAYLQWHNSGGDADIMRVVHNPICFVLYKRFDRWAIHSYGLTDAVLSRVDAPANRPGHKEILKPLAAQLAGIVEWWGRPPARGMYRAAVEAGVAPPWARNNLDRLELMERKLYNSHDFFENLRLAFHLRERIQIQFKRKPRSSRKPPIVK
jgi:hypothetical protein